MRDWKMRDWNYRHQTAWVENAGLENSGTGNVWNATCGITYSFCTRMHSYKHKHVLHI